MITTLPAVVAATVAGYALPAVSAPTHAEFVAWARTQETVDDRIVDFLASRDDCAGATPAEWTRLATIGATPWFKALLGDRRRAITIGVVGEAAFNAYQDWAIETAMAADADGDA